MHLLMSISHNSFFSEYSEHSVFKGPLIFYEGGGGGGGTGEIWEASFYKSHDLPQLANFFYMAPLIEVIFLDDPPPPQTNKKI